MLICCALFLFFIQSCQAYNVTFKYWSLKPYIFTNEKNQTDGILRKIFDKLSFYCNFTQKVSYEEAFSSRITIQDISALLQNNQSEIVYYGPILTDLQLQEFISSMNLTQHQVIRLKSTKSLAQVLNKWHTNFILKLCLGAKNNLALCANGALIILLIATILWIVERKKNAHISTRLPQGLGTSLWLAAVTVTTVGYGDVTPKTGAGRSLCVLFVTTGVVIMNVTIGSVSNSVFGTVDFSFEKQTVAVLRESKEAYIAGKKFHAKTVSGENYTAVLDMVRRREVFGALVNYDILAWTEERFTGDQSTLRVVSEYKEIIPVYFVAGKHPYVSAVHKKFHGCKVMQYIGSSQLKKKFLPVTVLDYEKGSNIFTNPVIQVLMGVVAVLAFFNVVFELRLHQQQKDRNKNSERK